MDNTIQEISDIMYWLDLNAHDDNAIVKEEDKSSIDGMEEDFEREGPDMYNYSYMNYGRDEKCSLAYWD